MKTDLLEQNKKALREKIYVLARAYEVEHLYKYRSFSSLGLEDIFLKQEIYLPSPNQFNDPFDCSPRFILPSSEYKRRKFYEGIIRTREPNATKGRVKKLMQGKGGRKVSDPNFLKELFHAMLNNYGIYSMSEVNHDILMWAHYANAHTGICLEFDAQKAETFFWGAIKVTYQKQYPPVNPMDFGKYFEFHKAICVKSEHWSYEKERRAIRTEVEGGPGICKFSPELLKGVILGARVAEADEKKILGWIEKYPTAIKLYRAKINEFEFKLDIMNYPKVGPSK